MSSLRLVWALLLSASVTACASHKPSRPANFGAYKVGVPYQIGGVWYYPREQTNYNEVGLASWYGPGFNGRPTANGEKYDQRDLTAAHATLPMPVNVRVTNLDNGRSLVLRINDRGPFHQGRIIDVSERAAEMLGFKEQGTAHVRVEYLSRADRDAYTMEAKARPSTNPSAAKLATSGMVASNTPAPRTAVPGAVTMAPIPNPIAEMAPVPNAVTDIGSEPLTENLPAPTQSAPQAPPKPEQIASAAPMAIAPPPSAPTLRESGQAPVIYAWQAGPQPLNPNTVTTAQEEESATALPAAEAAALDAEIAAAQAAGNARTRPDTSAKAAPEQAAQSMTATPTPSATGTPKMYVQVASFTNVDYALVLYNELLSLGKAVISPLVTGNQQIYRVRLGPVANADEASRLTTRLKERGHDGAQIVME